MTPAAGARPLDRHSPMPLWAQLHDDLTRRLALGAFDQGFPGENELVDTYAASRHTVREALRRLREAGVLESARVGRRRCGAGSSSHWAACIHCSGRLSPAACARRAA